MCSVPTPSYIWFEYNKNKKGLIILHLKQYLSIFIITSSLFFFNGCFEVNVNKPLKSTYWSLIELNQEDSTNVSSQPEVHLVFHINNNTLHGSDGCNRIQTSYTQDENSFHFNHIIATRIYCEESMAQADAFMEALSKTDKINIEEDVLILYSADTIIAKLQAKDEY